MRDRLIELVMPFVSGSACGLESGSCEFADCRSCNAQDLANRLLANGVTVQEWISVKDRLPEDIDTYLVVVKYKYDFEKDFNYATDVATYNPYENAYIDDCWCTFNDWDEGQQYLHITHWMPMPDVPKGE